jgi:hypothetical protein
MLRGDARRELADHVRFHSASRALEPPSNDTYSTTADVLNELTPHSVPIRKEASTRRRRSARQSNRQITGSFACAGASPSGWPDPWVGHRRVRRTGRVGRPPARRQWAVVAAASNPRPAHPAMNSGGGTTTWGPGGRTRGRSCRVAGRRSRRGRTPTFATAATRDLICRQPH